VFVGQIPEVALVASRHESLFGPVDACILHRLTDDEEVRQCFGGCAGARNDVENRFVERE